MGKTFDAKRFRQDLAYRLDVSHWVSDGNLSYFDIALWDREWNGESDYFSSSPDSAFLETVMRMWSELQWAVRRLYVMHDAAIGRGDLLTANVTESVIAEINDEMDAIDDYLWED